jgi:acetoin utilization protein AcuB
MIAEEIMTHNVATVRSDERLSHAVATLIELPVRHLPVVDDGRLVGMLSDRDMRELGAYEITLEKVRQLSSMKVSDVMTRNVVTADPATAVPDLIQSMLEARIGAVPVVEAGTQRLVGIVSYADLLRAAAPRFE